MNALARRAAEVVPLELFNIDGEALLLSAMLTRNVITDVVADRVDADDFYEPAHAAIFAAIMEAQALGSPATPVSLAPRFQNDERLQAIGGSKYLSQLTGNTGALLLDHKAQAEQIADLAARRRLISELEIARARVVDPDLTLAQLVDDADSALVAAVERREGASQTSAAQAIDAVLARIDHIQSNEGRLGTTTGISDIDQLLGGFEPGQLIIMAGRPGMGKTAVACSSALGCAKQGNGVLFVSLEMQAIELGMRIASDLCFHGDHGIEFGRIVSGKVSSSEMRLISRAAHQVREMPLTIVDAGSVTIPRLALSVRRHKRRMKVKGQELKLVVIDYLQLLQASRNAKSAYEQVSEISKALKALAKDAGVAILALAQLSRAVEQRPDKRPMLADLRDSGQIEQDADAVLFLYREEYYLKQARPRKAEMLEEWERSCVDAASRIDFICAKRRNGQIGERRGWYFAAYQAVRGSDDRQDAMI